MFVSPVVFAYCREALALSEHEAYNRIEAARAARRFPVILEMLAEGSVNLTTVRLLAPHLTPDNCQTVLKSARGKRKTEVEEIVARLSPRPDVAPSMRKLPALKPAIPPPAATLDLATPIAPRLPGPPLPPPASSADVTPLSLDRYKIQLTIGGDTLQKLREGHVASRDPIRRRRGHSRARPDRAAGGPGQEEVRRL